MRPSGVEICAGCSRGLPSLLDIKIGLHMTESTIHVIQSTSKVVLLRLHYYYRRRSIFGVTVDICLLMRIAVDAHTNRRNRRAIPRPWSRFAIIEERHISWAHGTASRRAEPQTVPAVSEGRIQAAPRIEIIKFPPMPRRPIPGPQDRPERTWPGMCPVSACS